MLILILILLFIYIHLKRKNIECFATHANKIVQNISEEELSLVGYLSNKDKNKKLFKYYGKNGIYFFTPQGEDLIPLKNPKDGDIVNIPNEKPFVVKIQAYNFYQDEYSQVNKYNIEVPALIEDYKYFGVLQNPYLNEKYYIYEKIINSNMKLYNYLVYEKVEPKMMKLQNTFLYQFKWQLGDPIRIELNGAGVYALYIIAP